MEKVSPQHDVQFRVKVELIPPSEELIPVQFGSKGPTLGGEHSPQVRSFIWKKVDKLTVENVDEEDTSRVFCGETGKLILCFHRAGKNPYGQGISEADVQGSPRFATGYNGMTSFSVVKELFSSNGRHLIQDEKRTKTYFSIANVDEFAVIFDGDSEETAVGVFKVPVFLREAHGTAIVNLKQEVLASVKKAPSSFITNVSYGDGAEYQIDVAPGVDWTAILALVGGFGQNFVSLEFTSLSETFTEAFAALQHRLGWQ